MSSIQLDGTHTPAKRGGEAVDYQRRKKCKTSNMLILSDSRGIPISCSEPRARNHNHAYNLSNNVNLMLNRLKISKINTDGLFLNADAGFDTKQFRHFCFQKDIIANICKNNRNGNQKEVVFDEKLYKRRFVIERTNAWLDAFKAILVRFEINNTLESIEFNSVYCNSNQTTLNNFNI